MPEAIDSAGGHPKAVLHPVVEAWLGKPSASANVAEQFTTRFRQWTKADDTAQVPASALDESTVVDERSRVHALLLRLDATLDPAIFDTAWVEAGEHDAARLEAFTRRLAQVLNIAGDSGNPQLEVLEHAASTASGSARFVRLAAHTGSELETYAAGDAAMRRALAEGAPWALVGDRALSRRGDPAGRYERFDSDTGEALLSDAWIGDRARLAAWRAAASEGEPLDVEGAGWRFIDRSAGDTEPLLVAGSQPDVVHQVIFAGDGGETIDGGSTTDRMHGGAGDDVLRGRAGADLLQGADGDDVLRGGSGNDDLAGQRGADELDGGIGDDRLDGGGGDDEIVGNRGNDLLRGGKGVDRYHFEAGDGVDVLVDEDGGLLYFEGEQLAGTMQRDGDAWVSADSRYRITLDGDPATGGMLTISAAAVEGATVLDSVSIPGWIPGRFGISLGGDATGAHDGAAMIDEALAGASSAGHDNDGATIEASGGYRQINDGDTFYPPTLPDGSWVDWFGSEGSLGFPPPMPLDALLEAADATADGASHDDASPSGGTLVDLADFANALDSWGVPSPPDIASMPSVDASLPTPADVADALASDGLADMDDGSMALTFDVASIHPRLLSPDPRAIPGPPEALLRASLS